MTEATIVLLTLIAYKAILLGIGLWATLRTRDGTDFYLGGRGLGPWVAALSAAASSSSAWSLLGVSGAAYSRGLSALWILPACFGGFCLNWYLVAPRMRRLAGETNAVTVTELLAHGSSGRPRRRLIVSASLIVLLCLGTYVASQFQASGKSFAETFDMEPASALLLGAAIVVLYTMAGGFWAVSVTDMLQGLVMAAAAVTVPVAALVEVGGLGGMFSGMAEVGAGFADPFAEAAPFAALGLVVGYFGIGLGYPGQPHVVNRFMALRDDDAVRVGRRISLTWAFLIYTGMLIAGWCGRVLVTELGDTEAILLRLTSDLFPAVVSGVILAAVLSAIMSTADSQLLVCGAVVAHDLPERSGASHVLLDRLAVLGICVVAALAALLDKASIFDRVLFAWSGLGAAFGPLLLVRLWRGPVAAGHAFASMWLGFTVTLVWFYTPALKAVLYELVPAFAAALVPAWLGSRPAPAAGNAPAA